MKANVRFIKSEQGKLPLAKALNSNNAEDIKETELAGEKGILQPPYPIKELQNIVEISTILQQCIDAYKRNIVGFGAVPAYLDDDVADNETPEMKAEWDEIDSYIKYFNFDQSFEDVFGEIIEDREKTGNGYLEVIRDGVGMPSGGERLDPQYIYITKLGDPVDVKYIREGKTFTRKRRFRKYVQDIGTKKVYFKEFGDPRIMDSRNGEYVDSIEEEYAANEIIHFKIGSGTYGVPRWIGQLIHMYGARKAEELNFRYFTQGRHTPMAILLHNAELSPESEQALIDYATAVEGVDNSHKFLVIEAEGLDEGILADEKINAKVELKSLAEMLQQDALFLEYDNASREKVQSAFRLPDIYVGRSKDFNRATADCARFITEEQVFEPERKSLEWIINNKLFQDYQFQSTKMIFSKPEISNAEDIVAILNVANQVGAIAPNDVRDIIGDLLGKRLDNLEGDEFNLPKGAMQARLQAESMAIQNELAKKPQPNNEPFQKAYEQDEVVSILKDLRDVLEELNMNGES